MYGKDHERYVYRLCRRSVGVELERSESSEQSTHQRRTSQAIIEADAEALDDISPGKYPANNYHDDQDRKGDYDSNSRGVVALSKVLDCKPRRKMLEGNPLLDLGLELGIAHIGNIGPTHT